MVWPIVFAAVGAVSQSMAEEAQHKIDVTTFKANKTVSEIARKANNQFLAAQGNLRRGQQVIRNQVAGYNRGRQVEDLQLNYQRHVAASQEGSLDNQIASAEAAGAMRAAMAYNGGGSSTNDMLSMTNALRTARVERMAEERKAQATSDFNQTIDDAMAGTYLGMEGIDMVDGLNMAETLEQIAAPVNHAPTLINFAMQAGPEAGRLWSNYQAKKAEADEYTDY